MFSSFSATFYISLRFCLLVLCRISMCHCMHVRTIHRLTVHSHIRCPSIASKRCDCVCVCVYDRSECNLCKGVWICSILLQSREMKWKKISREWDMQRTWPHQCANGCERNERRKTKTGKSLSECIDRCEQINCIVTIAIANWRSVFSVLCVCITVIHSLVFAGGVHTETDEIANIFLLCCGAESMNLVLFVFPPSSASAFEQRQNTQSP